jgi:serine/threonine protein kinase
MPSSRSTSMLDRLHAEITIQHQVKHPNIVELLNCFCDEKYFYLILELCSNGDLEHYLQEKKTLSEHESMRKKSFVFKFSLFN